jgi:hypothetical protein
VAEEAAAQTHRTVLVLWVHSFFFFNKLRQAKTYKSKYSYTWAYLLKKKGFCNATSSLVRSENNIFFYNEKCPSLP